MTAVPNQANIRKFVDALRSGDYQQGGQVLGFKEADGVDKFCCLGVATEVAIKCGVPLTRSVGYANGRYDAFIYIDINDGEPEASETRGIYLHPLVQEFYGFNSYNPETDIAVAGTMNDAMKMNFSQIADAFEQTYLDPPDTETHEEEG